MVLIKWLALIILFSLVPVVAGLADEAAGRVVSVISGDSLGIEMLIADPRTNDIDSIKLADIDAPSTVTAEGKAAKDYAVSLLKNKTVYLDIDDNISQARNQWSQLICLVYLMDERGQPLWPPVNRIIVDAGHAVLDDDAGNEFNASDWWGQPPSLPPGVKGDLLMAMLEEASSSAGMQPGDSNEVSILEKDSASGGFHIGYRN